jgi:hypothetical protein
MLRTNRRSAIVVALVLLAGAVASGKARGETVITITFTSAAGDSGGSVTVTNASTGSTTTSGLVAHLPAAACADALALAAPKVGFRAEVSGATVRIFGRGALVKATGVAFVKGDAGTP